jgi:hypothetical protein
MEARHPTSQIYVGTHTHNTPEVIQFLHFCRREVQIPETLLPFVYLQPALPVFRAAEDLNTAKALFLEVCNANIIRLGDTHLHRNLVKQSILVPLQKLGKKETALANAWYYQGIERADEATRRDAVNQLLPLVTGDETWRDRAEILREVRGQVQDEAGMKADIVRIAEMIGCKVLILGHVLRYMPDGRPLYWPSTFMVQLRRIAAELGLPVLDPAKVMQEVGPSFALAEDGHHYTQQFIDLMADRMYEAL